jgi:hypothetical protein
MSDAETWLDAEGLEMGPPAAREIDVDILSALRACYPSRELAELSDDEIGFAIAAQAESQGVRPSVSLAELGRGTREFLTGPMRFR